MLIFPYMLLPSIPNPLFFRPSALVSLCFQWVASVSLLLQCVFLLFQRVITTISVLLVASSAFQSWYKIIKKASFPSHYCALSPSLELIPRPQSWERGVLLWHVVNHQVIPSQTSLASLMTKRLIPDVTLCSLKEETHKCGLPVLHEWMFRCWPTPFTSWVCTFEWMLVCPTRVNRQAKEKE